MIGNDSIVQGKTKHIPTSPQTTLT